MAQLSLTEVSKRFNVNRTTIYRAVSSGKLSRLNNGLFDLAEVIRVFGEPPAPVKSEPVPDKGSKQHHATVQNETSLIGRFGRGLKAFLK